jgi:hypothetical protein
MGGCPRHHLHANAGPLRHARSKEGLQACTYPRVAPEFAHDLPRCDIPKHHSLVPAARAEIAVVKRAGEQERKGQRRLPIPASALVSRPSPRLTRPRPAPRSRGRCTSAAASPAVGSTASGSCRCRTSGSNCHQLRDTRWGFTRLPASGGRKTRNDQGAHH